MITRVFRSTGLAMSGLLIMAGVASAATVPKSLTATGTGMTITVNSVHLVTRAAVNVTVSIVCDPIDEFGTPVSALFINASVTVTEAVGKSLAQGAGQNGGNGTCDSTTVNHFTIFIVSSTVPFKAGNTAIQGFGSAEDDNFCCQIVDHVALAGAIKVQR
jgi:hypothetical protein